MFKLKSKKTFLNSVVSSERIGAFGIPISDLGVRLYKFPHIGFNQADVIKTEYIHLKEKTLKSKFWTKRFFMLVSTANSQNFQNGFKYQIRKFGFDISYKLIWHLFRAQVDYQISSQQIATHINRKMVRTRNEIREIYPIAIEQRLEKFEKNLTIVKSNFLFSDSSAPQQKETGDFSDTKDNQSIDYIATSSEISVQNSIQPTFKEMKISQVPFSQLDFEQNIFGASLFIKISLSGGCVQAMTPPQIHHVGVNSLYVYSLGKKVDQKKNNEAEESEEVIEIKLDETLD